MEKWFSKLSDLHLGWMDVKSSELVDVIQSLRPDLILLSGDYVKWNGNYDDALNFLSRITAKDGVWAVMGDYDYSRSRNSCLFCHEPGSGNPTKRHRAKFLRNSVDRIETINGPLWIGGIDNEGDAFFSKETLSFLNDKGPIIILSHSPLIFDLLDWDRDVLVLAGDTHGGQIPLPSWLWQFLGYEKNAKYEQGGFREGKKRMYVSRGIGTSHFPMRFLRPPEVTVLHFTADDSK